MIDILDDGSHSKVMIIDDYFNKLSFAKESARGVDINFRSEDKGSFIEIGPFLPLSGYAVSNFINREYFMLQASQYDLYLAQNQQRKYSRENSFVEGKIGEYVNIRCDSLDDMEMFADFVKKRWDDIEYVVSNPGIDSLLRDFDYAEAKNKYELVAA